MVKKLFVCNPVEVNCFVLYDETGEGVIIDPACFFPEEKEDLKAFIEQEGIEIKHLLNTHLHFDHCMGHRFCNSLTRAKLMANRGDLPIYEHYEEQAARFGFRNLDKPIQLARGINDGDEITFGKTTLKAIHVPGHSPGSICFYHAQSGSLFSGDVLFKRSIGRTDLPGGEFETLITGIKEKLLTLPDATVVYPGHGNYTTIGDEKVENIYLR